MPPGLSFSGTNVMTSTARPIAIYYEHPDWFRPLFAELDRRGRPTSARRRRATLTTRPTAIARSSALSSTA